MAQPQPLTYKRGTTSTITVVIPDSIDPTGATIFFTVKPREVMRSQFDDDSQAIFKKTITTHTGRTFTDTINPEDTDETAPGRYGYGITVKLANGDILGTSADGVFIITPRDTADTGD